jgi:hypothetical protein
VAGLHFVQHQLILVHSERLPAFRAGGRGTGTAERCAFPSWRVEERELWLGAQLLKHFRQPAPHQTMLLDVFQEENWSVHVEDPLPRALDESEEDAKRRLHETLKNLNRTLPPHTIRFRGDGTGQGVWWEYDQ